MNISENFSKENCCGCTACMSVCPKEAIRMEADEKGFLYPALDKALCVNCGLCVSSCDFRKPKSLSNIPIAYAVKHKNVREVETSRSGAVFMAMCAYALSREGVVFGCEMMDKNTIVHTCHSDKQGIDRFKGSKYVQSNLGCTFQLCRSKLTEGKTVLFSGTGCQVHGLLSYLSVTKTNTKNLLTCDVVCHGCPSPEVWKVYVELTEKKIGKQIATVDFRDKSTVGWKDHFETLFFEDSTKLTTNEWRKGFYSHVLFRESCYHCKYASIYRQTDFTIADCWGIEKVAPEFDDNKGVSLLLINTSKGEEVFDMIRSDINYRKIDVMDVLQPQLTAPVTKGKDYDWFWRHYIKDKQRTVKRFLYPSRAAQFKKKVLSKLGRLIT